MAVVYRARWKPQVGRTSLESLIQGFDPATSAGTVVLVAQIVMYDDARYNPAVAIPGRDTDESELAVLWEEPLSFDLSVWSGMTQANLNTTLASALDNWAQTIKPAGPGLIKIWRAVRNVGMRPIP